MSTGEPNCPAVPRFLVSTTMLQSSIVLQPGSIITTLPMNGGPLLLETSTKHSDSGGKHSLDELAASRESNISVVKVSAKGRRPKSVITEIQSGLDLGMGMLADRPMCGSCGKYFMSRQQLNQHMLVHTDVRKYKCTYCDRTFKQPSHLHQHHRIHTGEKPYKCPIPGCFRAFPQQSNLNHHLRNHDKPAPPPENTCSLCMRTYASETVLRSHISKIHMCDPDLLLGARKKTQAKDISRSQTSENVVQIISPARKDIKRIKLSETSENDSSDEKNIQKQQCAIGKHLDAVTHPNLIHKREIVYGGNAARHNLGYVQESDSLSDKFESIDQRGHDVNMVVMKDTFSVCNKSSKIVRENNNLYHSATHQTDSNLLHHFIATTTHRPTLNESRDLDTIQVNKTCREMKSSEVHIPSSELSQSMNNTSIKEKRYSDIPVPDETVPSHFSRSRKRKAFLPQRIIQQHDDQEHTNTIHF